MLLTGGFGSVVGIFFGTITIAIVTQGIYYTRLRPELVLAHHRVSPSRAVLMNNTFRKMALSYSPKRGQVMTTPILALRGVNKSFGPDRRAARHHAGVPPSEVLCLLGDNGAGKSTLIKIMSGVHQPSSGQIELDGQPVTLPTPRAAQEAGISTVHQFGGTFPLMSIGRSFFVGVSRPRAGSLQGL